MMYISYHIRLSKKFDYIVIKMTSQSRADKILRR